MHLNITLSGKRLVLVTALVATAIAVPATAFAVVQTFNDVPPSNTFFNDINAIAAKGVTTGCGGGNYCPKDYVTREQMAAFMNRLGALSSDKTPVVNAATLDGIAAFQFAQIGHITMRSTGDWFVNANYSGTADRYTGTTRMSKASAGAGAAQLSMAAPTVVEGTTYAFKSATVCFKGGVNETLSSVAVRGYNGGTQVWELVASSLPVSDNGCTTITAPGSEAVDSIVFFVAFSTSAAGYLDFTDTTVDWIPFLIADKIGTGTPGSHAGDAP